MASQTALIIGVTGMVGEPLANALLTDGWRVIGACRFNDTHKEAALQTQGVETIRFDILEEMFKSWEK